eukprot:TRINITY_DN32700_c0_g1_i1.p1 TRINITY_DN32700_c0_g1~~TRINITY_DN32700_c0_g1_i1.p1  ORF type:complete len:138 (+),score=6.09 TRINITY_DN32700_c0_g1_i1:214-627(+)
MMMKIKEGLVTTLLFLVAVDVGIHASRLCRHSESASSKQQTMTISNGLAKQENMSEIELLYSILTEEGRRVKPVIFAGFAAAQTCTKHERLHCETTSADLTQDVFLDPNTPYYSGYLTVYEESNQGGMRGHVDRFAV